MATAFTILARLVGDSSAMVREFSAGFAETTRRGRRAADSLKEQFASATKRAAGRAFTVGAASLSAALGLGIKEGLDLERVLSDIRVQSGATAAEMSALRDAITATSEATGISRVELASASKSLVDLLGPVGRNADLMSMLARTAVASGASVQDLAGLVSAVSDSFGIAADDVGAMEGALSAFLSTGKQGKVPLEEMNAVLQEVASNFAEMGGTGKTAAADVSAAIQVARTSFGSAGQAGTGLKSGVTALKRHGKDIDKAIRRLAQKDKSLRHLKGFTVWADKGKTSLRDFRELAPALAQLNLEQLTELMGSAEAAKFWASFKGEGWDNFTTMADRAREANDVTEDFAKRQDDAGQRMSKAWNRAKLALGEAVTPDRIERFVAAVESLVDVFGWLVDNISSVVVALGSLKALQMALEFRDIAKNARDAAAATKDAATAAAEGRKAGAAGIGAKVAGGAAAAGAGFAAGQILGGQIVRDREKSFEAQQKRQARALAEMRAAAEATTRLQEAGLLAEGGALTPEAQQIERQARAKRLTGGELSQQEQDVITALGGYEVAKKAEAHGLSISGIKGVVKGVSGATAGPERRRLVTSEATALEAYARAFEDGARIIADGLRANTDAQRAAQKPTPAHTTDMGKRGGRRR